MVIAASIKQSINQSIKSSFISEEKPLMTQTQEG